MILSGRKLAKSICKSIKKEVSKYSNPPGLGIILVGDNPASKIYVNMKKKACQKVGFQYVQVDLPENSSNEDVIRNIYHLNYSKNIQGVLVQLPLPEHLNERMILDNVSIKKDVDCFHTENFGKLALSVNNKKLDPYNLSCILPCTPRGVLTILEEYNIPIRGQNITILGSSNIVGLPLSMILLNRGGTVSICNINTQDYRQFTKNADVIIAATGNPHLIKKKDVKKDSVIIDVGINKLISGEIVGDVDYHGVKDKVSAITPVPGGVGPMTIAMVLQNTLDLYKKEVSRFQI